jgi:hypothetical protein
LIASKHRILLVSNKLRTLLVANKVRTLLIGGGIILFVGVALPLGWLIYSSNRMADKQEAHRPETVTCDAGYLSGAHACIAPTGDLGDSSTIVCEAESRALVGQQGYCQVAPR